MQIVDLIPEHHHAYFHCLEPDEETIRDGVERKRVWYERMRDRGLIVKLAIDDDGLGPGAAGVDESLVVQSPRLREDGSQGHGHIAVEAFHEPGAPSPLDERP